MNVMIKLVKGNTWCELALNGFYCRFLTTMVLKSVCEIRTSVPSFQVSSCYRNSLCSVNCLASDVIIGWQRATRTGRIMALIMVQRQGSMRTISDSWYRASDAWVWH